MKKFGTQKPSLRFKSLLLSLFLTLNSGVTEFAQAGGCSHSHGCEADLLESCGGENRNMIIFGSGQNTREMPEIRRAAQIAYDVSRSLGLSIPPTIIRFMNASEMAALSSTAGHPAPHFHDGSQIISSSSRAGGILEFVTPGTTSHQFVRDTNTLHDTILVFAHVGGHYDFGENTRYFVSRSPDQMKYSYELATYMAQLYTEYDHDEVAEFYQRLLSLEYLQDLTRGGFEAPESFQVDRSRPDRQQIPQTTTQSILQAFISHLPSSEPRWKHELARLFERLHRVLPAYIQTKTMNEGWATFMEYMILSHTEWKTTDDELRFGILNSGVRSPGLSNPYWLGTEGWMRIWNRFKERPEVRDLPALEQDRRFIAEAHHIIATHNDFEFIRMAFDEKWVRDHHLYLKRPISRTERGRPYNYQHNRLVVTRDPKRIVNWISQKVANRDWTFPRIELLNLDSGHDGGILLRHIPVHQVPLARHSVATTLYELAKLMRRPITLETIGSADWFQQRPPRDGWGPVPPGAMPRSYPLVIRVTPHGEVAVSGGDEHTILPPQLQPFFERRIELHRHDVSLSYSENHVQKDADWFRSALIGGEAAADEIAKFSVHAPTAGQALQEYFETVALRLERRLRMAVSGQWPVKFPAGGKTLRIRVLPEIPHFELDRTIQNKLKSFIPPTPPETVMTTINSFDLATLFQGVLASHRSPVVPTGGEFYFPDEDLTVGQGDHLPGHTWKEDEQEQNQGQGEGDGDDDNPESGEPSDEPGNQGGNGDGGDPSVVEVPIELYGRILAESIELRNLRKTMDGENPEDLRVRTGYVRQPRGQVNWNRTAANAFALGMALARRQSQQNQQQHSHPPTMAEMLKEGLKRLLPEHYVVADRTPEPEPQIDAVVVWVRDTSGSMDEHRRKIISDYVANTRALLKTKYPFLKERFVIYSDDARETNADEFFTLNQGGGTNTKAGLKLAREIIEKYSHSRYNRFAGIFSDGDDFDAAGSMEEAEKLANLCEHTSYGHVDQNADHTATGPIRSALSEGFRNLEQQRSQDVGFAILNRDLGSILNALKRFYGKR